MSTEKPAKPTLFDFEKPLDDLYQKIYELKELTVQNNVDLSAEIHQMESRSYQLREKIYKNLTPMQVVQIARHPDRPTTMDYWENCFDRFIEIKGDRLYGDDPALIGAFAWFNGQPVVTVGHQKGRTTKTRIARNFGMANPEGYRKALRLFKQAEKFQVPIVAFVDTPGAFPGLGAEERGQAEAIARNLMEMMELTVPVIVIVIGEGASGGALGIAVGNTIGMMQYAWYSVISPEGCAAILWKDSAKASTAAEILKLTAADLLELKVIDHIIPEPVGGAHWDRELTMQNTKKFISDALEPLKKMSSQQLKEARYQKFRNLGPYRE
jgi:acetyl-CoA carboxylase carboxyl transferase subunit alpha